MAKKEGVELKGPQINSFLEPKKPAKKVLSTILFIILGLLLIVSLILNATQFLTKEKITQIDIDKLSARITTLQEDNTKLQEELTKAQSITPTDRGNFKNINEINTAKKELKTLIETIDVESKKTNPDKNILKTKTEQALQTIDDLTDKIQKHNTFLNQNSFQELNKELQIEINELNIKELEETKTMLQLIKSQIP